MRGGKSGLSRGVDHEVEADVTVLETIDHHLVDDLVAPVAHVGTQLDGLFEAVVAHAAGGERRQRGPSQEGPELGGVLHGRIPRIE